jgi:hypothetical protein
MMPGFDPSKLDPKVLMELSQLIRELPPEKLSRMQTLMHNMMAGFDVSKEMEEFERTLPPGFREKILSVMGSQAAGMAMNAPWGSPSEPQAAIPAEEESRQEPPEEEMDLHSARLTILRGVADRKISPEEAERLLFKGA